MVIISEADYYDLIHTVKCLVHNLNEDHGILKGCEWLSKYQNYIVRCGENETDNNH